MGPPTPCSENKPYVGALIALGKSNNQYYIKRFDTDVLNCVHKESPSTSKIICNLIET